jgi:hypothetical protein
MPVEARSAQLAAGRALFGVALLLFCEPASPEEAGGDLREQHDRGILLRTARVDTLSAPSIAAHLRGRPPAGLRADANPPPAGTSEETGALHLLVRLHESMCTRGALAALLAPSDGRVLYHVSRCSFTVLASGRDAALALAGGNGVSWVGPMLPHYKVAPELLDAGQCPLRVHLEPPLCRRPHEHRVGHECRLPGREWAASQAVQWVAEMKLESAEAESATSVIVQCRRGDMARVAHRLASEAQVHWVDRQMPFSKRNFHAALNKREGELAVDLGAVWARGINGSGEVVHVADSGVDVGHCLFHDEAHDVPYNRVDLGHRKVVAYWTGRTGDRFDAIGGHGTHVAASVAGSLVDSTNPAGRYQGIAPGARLAVTDAEVQTASDGEGSMILKDIVEEVFSKPAREAAAHVQSHSWGTQEYSYTQQAADVDRFLHDNREAMLVWAAGNDAASKPMQTIGSPATAKNCLTVGATLAGLDASTKVRAERHPHLPFNQRQLKEEPELFSNEHVQHFSGRGPCSDGRIKPDIVLPGLVQSARSNGRLPNFNCCLNPGCSLKTQCPKDCSNQGQCGEAAGAPACQCRAGFCGADCSIKTDAPVPATCCPPSPSSSLPCASTGQGECRAGQPGTRLPALLAPALALAAFLALPARRFALACSRVLSRALACARVRSLPCSRFRWRSDKRVGVYASAPGAGGAAEGGWGVSCRRCVWSGGSVVMVALDRCVSNAVAVVALFVVICGQSVAMWVV